MALSSVNRWPGPVAPGDTFSLNFVGGYLDQAHVHAYEFDPATQTYTPISITFVGPYTITGATVSSGKELLVRRETPDLPLVDFVQGARLSAVNLDTATHQAVLRAAEAVDYSNLANITDFSNAVQAVLSQVDTATQAAVDSSNSASTAQGYATAALGHANAASSSASAASTSATNAQNSATAAASSASSAGTAKTDAQAAASAAASSATAADGSAGAASISAGQAQGYANNAQTSANAAAASATAASTSASNASTSATAASGSASAASTSAANAQSSYDAIQLILNRAGATRCHLGYYVGTQVILTGQSVWVNGAIRAIPSGSVRVTLPDTTTVYNIYAYMSGSTLALQYSATNPFYNSASGVWQSPDMTMTCVGWAMGSGMATTSPAMYEEGPNVLSAYTSTGYVATANPGTTGGTWNGTTYTIASTQGIVGPSSYIDMSANLAIMTEPLDRVGDVQLFINGTSVVSLSRMTHEDAYSWRTHTPRWNIQRLLQDTAALLTLSLRYAAISTSGGNWTTLGDPDRLAMAVKTAQI